MANDNNYNGYNTTTEIDLIELTKYLWRCVIIIILMCIAGALIGGGYAYLKNRSNGLATYESNVSIYCDPVYADTSAELILAVQTSLMEDYCEFATSRTVIESVIEELGLNERYEDIKDTVSAEVVATQILQITVFNDDATMAQKLASAIADATVKCIKAYSKYSTPNVLDEANLPTTPSTTGRKDVKKYALIGALLGIILGCIIFTVKYIFSGNIFTESDVQRFLNLRTLAIVKKGDSVEDAIARIKQIEDFVIVELSTDSSTLDDYVEALKLAKEDEKIIIIVRQGMGGQAAQKVLEKINIVGCKVEGAILVEK